MTVNITNPEPWMEDAACRSHLPDEWFPAGFNSAPRYPILVCGGCSVRRECLAFALKHDEEHGIWGGLTPRERLRVRALHLQLGGAA